MRYANHGEGQGRGNPPYTHRLRPQDFDTLGDRMQPPTDGYSVLARIFALIFFIVVVTVVSYLRRQ
jgi:hypothetical protein